MPPDVKEPIRVAYQRRDPDLDPQLVWRGKDVLAGRTSWWRRRRFIFRRRSTPRRSSRT